MILHTSLPWLSQAINESWTHKRHHMLSAWLIFLLLRRSYLDLVFDIKERWWDLMHLCLRDRSFSRYWQGMCVRNVINQIYTYIYNKKDFFSNDPLSLKYVSPLLFKNVVCNWMLLVQISRVLHHQALKTTTIPKRGSIVVCFEDNIAEKPKCVGNRNRNNESCPLCYLYIDDMLELFAT